MTRKKNSGPGKVVTVKRKAGGLRRIETSTGRRFLVIKNSKTEHLLQAGTEIEEEDRKLLEGSFSRAAGMRLARNLLSVRDRAEREIINALVQEGVENEDIISYITETLREHGYIDDRRFASDFIEYRMKYRSSGPGLIKKKLLAAGVDEKVIEDEIGLFFGGSTELETALRLVTKKFPPSGRSESLVRRVNGFLCRKGFRSEVVNDICSRILRKELLSSGEYEKD